MKKGPSAVEYRGAELRMFSEPRRIPIYVAAAGPKMLRMAGRVADGVIIGSGILPEVIAQTLGQIRDGAESVGRSLEDLDLWWLCGARIADSGAEAEERMLSLTAALINAHGQVTLGGKLIPDDILDDAQYLIDHYDFNAHVKHGPQVADADVNGQLLRSLPRLREYASRRYVSLVGRHRTASIRSAQPARQACGSFGGRFRSRTRCRSSERLPARSSLNCDEPRRGAGAHP